MKSGHAVHGIIYARRGQTYAGQFFYFVWLRSLLQELQQCLTERLVVIHLAIKSVASTVEGMQFRTLGQGRERLFNTILIYVKVYITVEYASRNLYLRCIN